MSTETDNISRVIRSIPGPVRIRQSNLVFGLADAIQNAKPETTKPEQHRGRDSDFVFQSRKRRLVHPASAQE